MDIDLRVEALDDLLSPCKPEVFNNDREAQYTDREFTGMLRSHDIAIRMGGKGRANANVTIEHLWRTVKYE